jgi:thiol-disulfide isomerase/thioredoxin
MQSKLIISILLSVEAICSLAAQGNAEESPVSYLVTREISAMFGTSFEVNVTFSIQKEWYIYAPTGVNASRGKIETKVVFTPPSGISRSGKIQLPKPHYKNGYQAYEGDSITMSQKFQLSETIKPGQYEINVKVTYQTCNDEICLPPVTDEVKIIVRVNDTNESRSIDIKDESLILKFTALDGHNVDVSSLKGKIVLIDCWATWCGPCLQEMPRIKELYDKYHDKGFEVIGISMDEPSAKERVKKLIKQKNIPWSQRFEGKGFEEDSFRKQYDIKSLPTVYLLNKEGIIVDTNARGERLEELIKQYLNL